MSWVFRGVLTLPMQQIWFSRACCITRAVPKACRHLTRPQTNLHWPRLPHSRLYLARSRAELGKRANPNSLYPFWTHYRYVGRMVLQTVQQSSGKLVGRPNPGASSLAGQSRGKLVGRPKPSASSLAGPSHRQARWQAQSRGKLVGRPKPSASQRPA